MNPQAWRTNNLAGQYVAVGATPVPFGTPVIRDHTVTTPSAVATPGQASSMLPMILLLGGAGVAVWFLFLRKKKVTP